MEREGTHFDQETEVDVLALGRLAVLVLDVFALNVDTLHKLNEHSFRG